MTDTLVEETASKGIMGEGRERIFRETYKVLAADSHSLTIQGVRSGEVLTINPHQPLKPDEYPPGKLIALSDPSSGRPN